MKREIASGSGAHPAISKPLSKESVDLLNSIAAKSAKGLKGKAKYGETNANQGKSKKDLAREVVERFRNTENSTKKYSKVSKASIINGVLDRISNPEKVYQEDLNLCGPAAFAVAWASYDPEGYARSVIHLFRYGYFNYNGWKVKANADTYGQSVESGMDSVDWVLLPAIRHSENAIYDYNPKNDRGIAAYTSHWEMSEWLERISGVTESRDSSPTISEMNSAFKKGKMQVLLVDWAQIAGSDKKGKGGSKKSSKPDSYINAVTGNHYVILKSKLTAVGNSVEFDVWTWARTESIKIKKSNLSSAIKDVFELDN
ncbi:MAG: hypothetical protein Crog4KO_18290 [Crocinitomicaceae bacterium]